MDAGKSPCRENLSFNGILSTASSSNKLKFDLERIAVKNLAEDVSSANTRTGDMRSTESMTSVQLSDHVPNEGLLRWDTQQTNLLNVPVLDGTSTAQTSILSAPPENLAPPEKSPSIGLRISQGDHTRTSTTATALQSKPFSTSSTPGHGEPRDTYVDHLHPEDVGISFCIRAEANFDTPAKHDPDSKHLHGLANVFFVPTNTPTRSSGAAKKLLRSVTGALDTVLPHQQKKHKMMFSGTSSIAIRAQFLLTSSAIASCLFVIASLSVEPACGQQVDGWIVYGHLINSILYALTAIPSRGCFGRVDWRLGEELNLPFEVLWSHVRSPGLWCDILSIGGLAAEVWHDLEDFDGRTVSPAQWLMVLQMLKSWRFLHPEDTIGVQDRGFFQGLLKLMFYLICFAHCVACALIFIGNYEAAHGEESWLSRNPYGFDMSRCSIIYEEGFYFAVIGLTSIGYGDLLVTPLEHTFNSFFLLVSQLFAAKVCADLTWLTSMYNQNAAEIHERQRSLVLALHKMGVPRVLAKRVLAFQRYQNTMHADNITHKAFHGLSSNLMQELRLCTFRKLVLQAPFLREQQSAVISFIADALYDSVYLPSDFIIRAGERGRELYFVRRGEARAFLGPNAPVWGRCTEVATFEAGSYFGELAMLTGAPRSTYVMATTYCICSILPYSAVESLVEQHPEAFTSLVQTMLKMYNESGAHKLKPECPWKDLSRKLAKKFNLHTDYEAFVWFKSHDENPDAEELLAKAFDKALQKLKVPILDRRIYWSELDTDASGGIDFEEFQGNMYFVSEDRDKDEISASIEAAQMKAKMIRRQSTQRSLRSVRRISGASVESFDSREFDAGAFEGLCLQLMEQNQELLREIKKLSAEEDRGLGTIRDDYRAVSPDESIPETEMVPD